MTAMDLAHRHHEEEEQQQSSAAAAVELLFQDLHIDDRTVPPVRAAVPLPLPGLDQVEEILHYGFTNKALLEEAFTDSSSSEVEFSYERLEYVGDSVLNLLFTKEQYFKYPDLPPGSLTRLRASNVDTEKLARVAYKHGLHRYLRHNKPLLEEQILEFGQAITDYPLHSNGLIDVPKVLADIVESIIGAVFIDSNFSLDTVWTVFRDLLEPIIGPKTLEVHPVTELYEACQKKNLKLKFVDMWKEKATFHVFVNDLLVGIGKYKSKKEIAHNRAAKDALNYVRSLPDISEIDDNNNGSIE